VLFYNLVEIVISHNLFFTFESRLLIYYFLITTHHNYFFLDLFFLILMLQFLIQEPLLYHLNIDISLLILLSNLKIILILNLPPTFFINYIFNQNLFDPLIFLISFDFLIHLRS